MRWIYFVLHFLLGFFALWLAYTYAKLSFLSAPQPDLWFEGLVETLYLVSGVIWGNVGWDTFVKKIPEGSGASLVTYALSKTLAPVVIALPFAFNVLEILVRGWRMWLNTLCAWQNLLLLGAAVVLAIILWFYRKSEMAQWFKAYGA